VRFKVLLALLIQCITSSSVHADIDQKLEKFKSLRGPEQVGIVFQERFHGRSLLFWKRSSERWLTAADARLSFEEEILVASGDASINNALVTEVNGNDLERVRYAVFLLCLRARFVPHSDFLIQHVNSLMSLGLGDGRISPFAPDLSKLDQSAGLALRSALESPNRTLRNSAKIYTFAALEDLSSVPTSALVERWRTAARKIPACFKAAPDAYTDTEESLPLLRIALAARGLEAAVAVSSLLKNEGNAEVRNEEIDLVRFVDSSVVRLRGSEDGRRAIQAVKEAALSHPLQYCWMRFNKTEGDRQKFWMELEDQFLRDHLPSWTTLVAEAFDQLHGEHLTAPAPSASDYRICNDVCGMQMRSFVSWLTEADPTFPCWEFLSSETDSDMLHPLFVSKIRRYHEMWLKTNRRNFRVFQGWLAKPRVSTSEREGSYFDSRLSVISQGAPENYSCLSAVIGSVRIARCAGR